MTERYTTMQALDNACKTPDNDPTYKLVELWDGSAPMDDVKFYAESPAMDVLHTAANNLGEVNAVVLITNGTDEILQDGDPIFEKYGYTALWEKV